MITLRIISASDLPPADINGLADPYVKVFAKNFGEFTYAIGRTKTIKNTLNPNWDDYIKIPFVIFDTTLRLSIFDSDALSDDNCLGNADTFPSIQNFYRSDAQVQTSKVDLTRRYKEHGTSSIKYSIIPTITNFDFKQKKNPKKVYVYLSFDSFQPHIQDNVHLLAYGMNKNGTLVDPIFDIFSRGEIEASHFSPSGLVQVYTFTAEDFQTAGLYDEQYFFILKATNFTGKVTLTFVSSPKNSNKSNYVDKFYIINNQYSINITNQAENCQFFYTFPVLLKFVKAKGQIEPFPIPSDLQTFKTTTESESISKIDQMTIKIGQLICPKGKSLHRRFEIPKNTIMSLNEAYEKCHFTSPHPKIGISIGWSSYTDIDLLAIQLLTNGRLLDPICGKKKKSDTNKSIKSGSDSTRGSSRGDNETTTIDIEKVSGEVKCILIFLLSVKSFRFDALDGLFIRVVDDESKKELMFMNLRQNEVIQETGLLWGVLGRVNGNWSIWTCNRFLDVGSNYKEMMASINDFVNSGEFQTVFAS